MRNSRRALHLCGLPLTLWLAIPASAAQPPEAIMQIMVIDTHDNVQAYLERVRLAIARQHKVAPGIGTRVYRASFAGPETNRLYIVLDYPSMAFMIEAQAKLAADADWNRLQREAGTATGRALLSNALFVDVTE